MIPAPKRIALLLGPTDGARRLEVVKRGRALGEIVVTYEAQGERQRELTRDEMIVAATNGRFEILVLPSLNVFRDSKIALGIASQLWSLGIGIESLDEPWVGESQETVATIYEFMRTRADEQRSEGARKALERARAAGRQIGRPRKSIDIDQALRLIKTMPVGRAAQVLGVGTTTLRRFLRSHEAEQAAKTRSAA